MCVRQDKERASEAGGKGGVCECDFKVCQCSASEAGENPAPLTRLGRLI